jgi:hypothetical protein
MTRQLTDTTIVNAITVLHRIREMDVDRVCDEVNAHPLELRLLRLFLMWARDNGKTFGIANYREVHAEYRRSIQ